MADKLLLRLIFLGRWFIRAAVFLIIGIVIFVVIGRQTINQIDSFRPNIEAVLSSNIGIPVSLEKLTGEWPRLVPIVEASSIIIANEEQVPSLEIKKFRAELDLFRSIRHWNLVWRELVVDNLSFTVVENSSGRWSLKSLGSETEMDLIEAIQPLILSRLIQLEKIEIVFEFYSGASARIQGASVKVENDDNFHRSEMSIYLFDQTLPSSFVIEGYGDPSNLNMFSGQGYINIQDLDISAPLAELARSLQPDLLRDLKKFNAGATSEIWIDVSPGGNITFKGAISASDLPLSGLSNLPSINNIRSEITGWYAPESDWGFRLQDFDLEWMDSDVEPVDLIFSQRLGSRWKNFDLSINHFNITLLSRLLKSLGLLDDAFVNSIAQISPSGDVFAVNFGNNDEGYYASANLSDIETEPFKGIPGIRGLDGYFEIHGAQGMLQLEDDNGLELFFPNIYNDYLNIQESRGTIHVQINEIDQSVVVHSSVIDAKLEAGDASFLFSVKQDRSEKKSLPEVMLTVGSTNLDASFFDQYLPYKLSPPVLDWLKQSNLTGKIKQFGLIQRSGSGFEGRKVLTTQLLFDAEQAELDYHPDWIGVRDFDASVLIDDKYTNGQVSRGNLGGVAIKHIDIELGTYPLGHSKSNLIFLSGAFDSSVEDAIGFLSNSPLTKTLGPLPSWDYKGDVKGDIILEIPLQKQGRESSKGKYNIESLISNASLDIVDTPIEIENINGALNYSIENGLNSNLLEAKLWGEPLDVEIMKEHNTQKLLLRSGISPNSLKQFVEFPWEEVVTGMIPIEGLLTINPQQFNGNSNSEKDPDKLNAATLLLKSDLASNEIRLPTPLAKAKNEQRDLAFKLHFNSDLTRLEGTLGDDLVTDLHFSGGELKRGLVSFDRIAMVPPDNEVLITAFLANADANEWISYLSLFDATGPIEERSFDTVLNLNLDLFRVSGLSLKNLKSEARIHNKGISINFESELLDGNLFLPKATDKFLKLNLTRLDISSSFLVSQIDNQTLDPRKFINADIDIKNITVDKNHWGDIGFELRSNSKGALFKNITGEIFGLKPGSDIEELTNFRWEFDGQSHISRLNGPVGIDNMSDFFRRLELDPPIDSKSGAINFDLDWQDQPWAFSKENLGGDFKIELNEGNFYTSPGGGSAALKLVSLFNFANWLRRLQLDFSDVVSDNLAYNDLVGTVEFDQGIAKLLEPLQVNMPSGRMSMKGDFNLVNETASAQLVATLPVATNLPWVVALLGNIPAAAGVYLTSKIVSKQVDRLSSISYQIAGSWDDIEVSVDEIFAAQLDPKLVNETLPEVLIED